MMMYEKGKKRIANICRQITAVLLTAALLIGCIPVTLTAQAASTTARYSVLVLDISGSMRGTPIERMKEAAKKFCASALKADGKNYIAVVSFSSSAQTIQEFTSDSSQLESCIDNFRSGGGTNTNQALERAGELLESINDSSPEVVKNIVLCSDGLPESGAKESKGRYKSLDYSGYRYANVAYNTATDLKEKCFIYTLGFFHSLASSKLDFARRFMNDLQNAGYYEVLDPDELEFWFGNIAESISGSIEFHYATGDEKDTTGICYYDDNYFSLDPTQYHPSLSTMSLCLALSGFNSTYEGGGNKYANKDRNVRDLLAKLQFGGNVKDGVDGLKDGEAIETNEWYSKKPQSDSIGVAFGNKKIGDDTVIAVVVRGGGYESEWAGNFTLGKSDQHYGFNQAKEQVLESLKSYINRQNITGSVKFWVVGYSRAAATANLVAAQLDSGYSLGNVNFDRDDIYAYCFETPQGTTESYNPRAERYRNIWNIINKNDPVPKVAMSDLGFRRYGQDHVLPDRLTTGESYGRKKQKMLDYYNQMQIVEDKGSYKVDDFVKKKIMMQYILPGGKSPIQNDPGASYQNVFLDEAINKLTVECIKSRSNYVDEYQNGLRVIFTTIHGTLFPDQPVRRIRKALEIFADKMTDLDTLGDLAAAFLVPGGKTPDDVINNVLVASLNEAGLNDVRPSEIKRFAGNIAELLGLFVVSHPELSLTAVSNLNPIGGAHYPELCYAWLMSEDKNYDPQAEPGTGDGGYRIIRINCPVDVEVYNSSNSLVTAIYNDVPQVQNEGIISMMNENLEKMVYLPNSGNYTVKLKATGDGEMNYGVSEYSTSLGMVSKIVNYFSVDIHTGDELSAYVPACTEINPIQATNLSYTLTGPNQEVIQPSSVLNNADAAAAYYKVEAVSEDTNKGMAFGSETYQYGSFARIGAAPADGYQFTGWYEGDTLVSTEQEYRFVVTRDCKLTAHFSEGTGDTTSNGSSSGSHSSGGSRSSGGSSNRKAIIGTWQQDANGWWYSYSNGSWPKDEWEYISMKWYYFGGNGYMLTGWQYVGDAWYYLDPVNGDMKTGWFYDPAAGYWYYLDPSSGKMQTGWCQVDGRWYYLSPFGAADGGVIPCGAMYANAWTPDGFYVNENGEWIP